MQRPHECRGCPLDTIAEGFSVPTGSDRLGVAVVAEALGEHEARESRALVEWAPAGSMFQRILDKAGINREDLVLWNVIACRPPGNRFENTKYEVPAAEHCRIHFDRMLAQFPGVKVILALGNSSLKALTGLSGKNRTVSSLRGYVLKAARLPQLVVPTYHPSFLRRGATNLIRVCVRDLLYSIEVAQGGGEYDLDPSPPLGFILSPSEDDVRDLLEQIRAHPELLIAYDIETDRSIKVDESELFKLEREEEDEKDDAQDEEDNEGDFSKALEGPIIQIQFSVGRGHAISLPWKREFLPAIREIIGSTNPKIGHNCWRFDDPLLSLAGMRVGGHRSDTLWGFHHSQPDLPAHLQFVASQFGQRHPWKHLAALDLAFYGAIDVEVLHRIWPGLGEAMEVKAVWDRRCEIRSLREGYEKHVEDLNPVLERISERGIPVNAERLREFGKEMDRLKASTYKELCDVYPEELLPPKQKEGYKKEPKEKEGLLQKEFEGVLRYYKPKEFKPSKDQLLKYMRSKGHRIPTRAIKKGEPGSEGKKEKESTDKIALEGLTRATGDSFYHKVVLYRNYEKLKSTYCGDDEETRKIKVAKKKDIKWGWQPRADGRVHSQYIFRPASGQLSTVSPNCQNAIGEKSGELGLKFRRCIEARPGRLLCEVDFVGLHAFMLGFLAGDPSYMRLASLGIHDYVAAHLLRRITDDPETKEFLDDLDDWLDLGDKALAERLGWIKKHHKVFRSKTKPAVHGYGFGLGAFKLWKANPETYSNQKEAQEILDLLNRLFPVVAAFREDIKAKAAEEGFLMSPFGYRRYFHEVFDYRPVKPNYLPKFGEELVKGKNGRLYKKVPGMDAEKAIAYLPANCSFGVKKDGMLALERDGFNERFFLCNEVHDSLLFECLEERVDECLEVSKYYLEAPSPCLVSDLAPQGLVCKTSASVGKDWASMKELG